jgi:hypothetical protein
MGTWGGIKDSIGKLLTISEIRPPICGSKGRDTHQTKFEIFQVMGRR